MKGLNGKKNQETILLIYKLFNNKKGNYFMRLKLKMKLLKSTTKNNKEIKSTNLTTED